MLNIILQRLKEQKNSILIYTGSLVGYALLMMSMFPSLKKMDINKLIESYPPEFAKFFGESGMATFGTIEGYLSMEYLSFFFMLIIMFYIGSAAGSAIAGQIEKREMDFNLSHPISRTKIIISESVLTLTMAAIIILITTISIFIFSKIFDAEMKTSGLAAFAVIAICFVWAHYGVGILLSSVLKSKIGVMLSLVGLSLASYVFLSLSRLIDKLKDLEVLSIYKLYTPEKILQTGDIDWTHVLILLAITLIGITGGSIIFNKKDI